MLKIWLYVIFLWNTFSVLKAREHDFPVDYYGRKGADRARGHIYKDLQYLLSKIRDSRDRLKTIYSAEPQFLKKEKISQAKTQYFRARELCMSAFAAIAEHRRDYVKDTALLKILEEKLKSLDSEIHSYSVFITKLHPLDLYARNYHLKPGKLLNFRKFRNSINGSIISGKDLVDLLKKAYFHFNLRTRTNLGLAEKILKPVVDEYPHFLPAAFWLARVYFDQERIEEAQFIMDRLIEVDPELVISKSLDSYLLSEDDLIDYSIPQTPAITQEYAAIDLQVRPEPERQRPEIVRTAFAFCLPGVNSAVSAGGLEAADVIYEYSHTKDATRLLALIGQTEMKSNLIGPLTELQTVDLEQIYYLDPLIVHRGLASGSEQTRADVSLGTLDGQIGYDFLVKKEEQAYPLQYYTSLERMDSTAYRYRKAAGDARKGLKISGVGNPYDSNRVRAVHIPVNQSYTVSYLYDQEIAAYQRLINGNAHLDAFSKNKITTSNLIIQKHETDASAASGVVSYRLFGEGPALVMVKGKLIRGIWQKFKLGSETRYLDEHKQEIYLSPGRTFIHLVPTITEVRIDTFDKI